MNNMKAKITALMLVIALALTGCMNANESIVINSDGSGRVETVISIDKQAYIDTVNKTSATTGGEKLSDADIKELEQSMLDQGYKIVTIDGKVYYQISEKETIKKGELQKKFGGDDASYVTTDTIYLVMSSDIGSADTQEMGAMYGANASADVVKMTVTVQMPNAIVSTNGTIDKTNPNKVSFNVPFDKSSVIFATTKKGVTTSTVKATIKKLNTVKSTKITKLKANKVKAKAKKATVSLKFKNVMGSKKYEIQYSTKKNFKGATSKTTKKTTYTIKNLKKGKKYYVRVRVAKINYAGVEKYSKWAKKSVKTKK